MKVPISWLKEYVDFDASPQELADRLTFSGMEVESIKVVGADYEGIVVGEIKEISAHPGADRLKLCRVNNGAEDVSIVCGASNYEIGDKVPFAGVGCQLPDGTRIRKAKIRGEESFGMICSEAELSLSEDHSGIMILDRVIEPGRPFSEVVGPPDTVIDLEITWNRADCQSIMGVAREVAALYGTQVKVPELAIIESDESVEDSAVVDIDDPEGCPRYTARVLSGVKLAPSPMWMQRRLALCGIRPINNVVDITNYVLLECGQPLHAFDYNKLVTDGKARIVVRRAGKGEKLSTLDGVARDLDGEMLVISAADRAVALAGVMGGEGSEIYDSTEKVLLESAYFRPQDIKKTSTSLGLVSESSYRFERGVDIGSVEWASARAAGLLSEFAGATACKGVIDKYPCETKPVVIKFRFQRARDLIGIDMPDDDMISILESLQIRVIGCECGVGLIESPLFRQDLQIEADIIEEIARIYGLDKIETIVPKTMIVPDADDSEFRALRICRETVAALGCSETMNYSFLSPGLLEIFGKDSGSRVVLPNPVSEDHSVLRNSLMPQMGAALAGNLSRQVDRACLFEIGRVFLKDKSGDILEEERLCVGLMGDLSRSMGLGKRSDVLPEDMFLWMKGLIERLCRALNAGELTFAKASAHCFEVGCAVSVSIGGEECGVMGLLNSDIRSGWRMPGPVAIAEINVKKLIEHVFEVRELRDVPAFPAVSRDMALLVSQDVAHEHVMDVIMNSAPLELTEVRLFDIYTGEGIGDGKRSLAYSLVYRSLERTLTDEDANGYHETIKSALKQKLNVEIR